jgi:alkylation response protein AidB-like acyl-CoA dehydrogenase
MSIAIAEALQRGEQPATAAALVKEIGTRFEQSSIETARQVLGREPDPGAGGLDALLAQAIAASPSFTLRGGTTEILRGIIARGVVGS